MIGAEPADASRRSGHDRRRLLVEHALAVGPRTDIDRVLEHARDAAVIFGAAEQDSVRFGDLLAEADPLLGRVRVEVLVVERQVADLDHRAVEIVGAQGTDRPRDLAVDAPLAKAADDDRDLVGHGAPPDWCVPNTSWPRKLRRPIRSAGGRSRRHVTY